MDLSDDYVRQNLRRTLLGTRSEGIDSETSRRALVTILVSIIGICVLIPFGIFAIVEENHTLGYFDLSLAFALIILHIYLRQTGNILSSIYTGTILAGALFLYLFLTGGVGNTGHLWFYTFPLFSCFLLGSKKGLISTAILFFSAIFFLSLNPTNAELAAYSMGFKIRFIMSFFVVSAYAIFFENIRENTQNKLTLKNNQLNYRIEELRRAEEALRESRENLKKRVEQRTADLKKTNEALLHEIRDRKKVELDLRESESKYRLLADNVSDNIWTMDLDRFRFTYVSPSVERQLGYTASEALNMSLQEILSPDSLAQAINAIHEELALEQSGYASPKRTRSMELVECRKGGSTLDVEVTASFLREENGKAIAILGVTRDISERKRAEKELRKAKAQLEQQVIKRTAQLQSEIQERKTAQETAEAANLAKSQFLANMSHELRTPLNHIIGFTELVVDRKFGDLNEAQEDYLTDVLQSSKNLLFLINDILDLSKVEAGKLELVPTDVNLKMLLENSMTMIKEKAMKHDITVSTNMDGIPESITADERKLKQIIYNLLSNAIKFTPDGGKVSLGARMVDSIVRVGQRRGGPKYLQVIENLIEDAELADTDCKKCVEVSVSDSGIGINPEDQELIFTPFEQLDGSVSRKYQGTGLGLSLTKNLVELHGGKIWVESEGEGKGSTFFFVIPV